MHRDPSNDYQTCCVRLGLKIAYYRKTRQLTQQQLADAIGVSRTHISRIESAGCKAALSMKTFFRIAEVLNYPPSSFFHWND